MAVTRREFIKIAGMMAGGGLGASGFLPPVPASEVSAGTAAEKAAASVAATCEMCHWACGVIAKVVDGKVVNLEGNPDHPCSRGKLCARGIGGMGLLYDPDRVKTPLIRTGKRGDGKYRKASWDEALTYIAEKMEAIKKTYGPEAICLFAVGSCSTHLMPLLAAFGSQNFGNPSFAQCRGARDIGFRLTYGETPGSPERLDLGRSRAIVLFGSHLGENIHNSQVQDFAEGIGRKAKLIVVDPRFSTAAGKAAYWLPIRPGTDMALMLAWMNILIREGLYDRDYVERYTVGFEELASQIGQYTPEWASKETDISADAIVQTAREIGKCRPSVCIHPGRHSSWYGNDVQRSRCMAILTAMLGAWGREGGFFLAARGSLRKAQGKEEYPIPEKKPLMEISPYPLAGKAGLTTGVTTVVRDATITGKPYPIKGWIVMGTNILRAMPNEKETMDAVNNLDLLVTAEIMPLDTAMVSDVVLPSASYLEQFEDIGILRGYRLGVTMGRPAVKPLYESWDGYRIARELAKRLDLAAYFPWETLEDKIKAQCKLWKIDYEVLSRKGYIAIEGTEAPFITEQNQPVFRTPSGKIEIYSGELEKLGFDPIPKYTPVEQPEEGRFRLLYGRSPAHSFTRTTNNPMLHELFRENEVWINAKKAAELGVRNGEYVVLVNQDGVRSNRVRARVTQRIRSDCVYMVHGFCSSSADLRNAYRKGADDQGLITRYAIDPICGTTGMRVNFVQVVREI
ncbi:MAG: molybdopterin-dependent oxidoreductase [Desulfobacteraceae bacterium]|nr:molybdopterin-dependent oxidoreductase [Desulfobacteraceae bacterium]